MKKTAVFALVVLLIFAQGLLIGCVDTHRTDTSNKKLGEYSRTGDTVVFGVYPQSLKEEGVTVATEPDAGGYYLGSDGAKYELATASPNKNSANVRFADGSYVKDRASYYFKLESIHWSVLSDNGGELFLICDTALDGTLYNWYSSGNWWGPVNHYCDSYLRRLLSDTIYEKAFDSEQKLLLQQMPFPQMQCDEHTSYTDFSNILPATLDVVTNAAYGFNPEKTAIDVKRQKSATDYAIAKGVNSFVPSKTCCWWLTTKEGQLRVRAVNHLGEATSIPYPGADILGCVPTITLKKPQ